MTYVKKPKVDTKWETTKVNNFRYLPKIGNDQQPVQDFARIRSWGDKNSAITHDGVKVERRDFYFAEGYGMVRCVPYELHFIFEDTSKKIGRWAFMCTCGSIAGIISYEEIKSLMSVEYNGYVLACIAHTSSKQNTGLGYHADSSHE